jgi:hypothetical protein
LLKALRALHFFSHVPFVGFCLSCFVACGCAICPALVVVFNSSPPFRKEYPRVVPEIEKWLRKTYRDEEKFEILHHPENYAYGRILWKPCSKGIYLLDSVQEKIKGIDKLDSVQEKTKEGILLDSVQEKTKKSSSFFLWRLAWCFVWIALLPLVSAFALIFFLFCFLPLWFYLFGIKYIVLVMRKISYWINQLTPFFIILFLVYSPVCKQIAVPPEPAP